MSEAPQAVAGGQPPAGIAALMLRLLPLLTLGVGLATLANIVLARNMSQDEYGAFSFFLSSVSLMALIGLLGFQQTLPRFLSLYERAGQRDLSLGFMLTATGLVALATAVATVLGIYAVVPWIRNTASHQCLSDGYYMATAMALVTLLSTYLTYRKHVLVSSGAGPNGVVHQTVLIATVLLALLLPHSHTGLLAVEVVAAMGIAVVACLAIELTWCSFKLPNQIRGVRPAFRLRAWLAESLPVGGSAILGTLIYAADVIAVRLLDGSSSAASYAVASSLAAFVLVPRKAATRTFSREAPHLDGADRSNALQQLIAKVLRFSLLCALLVGAGIALFHGPLLGLYGQSYLSAWPVLLLLVAARVLESPVAIGVRLLNLEGHGGSLVWSNLWTGALFIVLLGLLAFWLGQTGAALAVLLFVLLSNATFYQSSLRYTGLRLLPFGRAPRPGGVAGV